MGTKWACKKKKSHKWARSRKKKCEWEHQTEEAIKHYEASKTNVFEVPRMLFDSPDVLQKYVLEKDELALRQWWAQYQERQRLFLQALSFLT